MAIEFGPKDRYRTYGIPSLDLPFADRKSLVDRISGNNLITFTRSTTGTYVGSDGLIKTAAVNEARFDHNPLTRESLGLLIEEARTNGLANSESLSGWAVLNAALVSQTTTDPTGSSSTVKLLQENTATSTHATGIFINNTYVDWQFSCFVKAVGRTRFEFNYIDGGSYIKFDLVAETVNGVTNSTILEKMANGWFRIKNIGNAYRPGNLYIYLNDSLGTRSYAGDGLSGLYIWGVQFEQATGVTYSSSYIPTSGSTVTRAADVATVSNTNSSIYPTSNFTIINQPYGTSGGGTTLKLVGPTIKRTSVYSSDLSQTTINSLVNKTDQFWQWRVLGSSFALPNFATNGTVTVDWGDGVVETLTTAVHTFTNGGGYHDVGFRLNSGTYFRPQIAGNSTYGPRVIAIGPAPSSMKIDAVSGFYGCGASLKSFDATVDATGGTSFSNAWVFCSGLTSFPLINTSTVTNFQQAWYGCSGLTSFPLINTAAGTVFWTTWRNCSSLTSFPLINTAAGTNFQDAWLGCSSLTSFPLINTSSGTNFINSWNNCSSLTSFPLINTAAGTRFLQTWYGCSNLTSFPSLVFSSGTDFLQAWFNCTKLASFPANMFNTTGTLNATAFTNAFVNCALTAQSIENILTSLVTNGQSNITLGLSGGTNANTSTWSVATKNAYITLVSRGWTITQNGTAPT